MSDKASFLKYINEVGGSDDESESSNESSIQNVHAMATTAQSTESGMIYWSTIWSLPVIAYRSSKLEIQHVEWSVCSLVTFTSRRPNENDYLQTFFMK